MKINNDNANLPPVKPVENSTTENNISNGSFRSQASFIDMVLQASRKFDNTRLEKIEQQKQEDAKEIEEDQKTRIDAFNAEYYRSISIIKSMSSKKDEDDKNSEKVSND